MNIHHEKNDRKCLAECNIEGKKFKYGLTCIEECSEGFYFEGNECKSMCTNKYFKKIYLDNALTKYNYQCIQISDVYILSNDNSKDECIDLTQNLCFWMYENNFTCSKLSLIRNEK